SRRGRGGRGSSRQTLAPPCSAPGGHLSAARRLHSRAGTVGPLAGEPRWVVGGVSRGNLPSVRWFWAFKCRCGPRQSKTLGGGAGGAGSIEVTAHQFGASASVAGRRLRL